MRSASGLQSANGAMDFAVAASAARPETTFLRGGFDRTCMAKPRPINAIKINTPKVTADIMFLLVLMRFDSPGNRM